MFRTYQGIWAALLVFRAGAGRVRNARARQQREGLDPKPSKSQPLNLKRPGAAS